jgi:hypothetical protein
MVRRNPSSVPSDLKAVRKRFEDWRTTRSGRSRIPESLWSLAVPVAKRHGIYRVSQVLRVNYQGLKRRVTATKPPSLQGESLSPFVELDLSRSFSPTECIIELEERGGPKMTIRTQRSNSVDVIGLTNAFFGRGR